MMIYFLSLAQLEARPELMATMFWDRRKQFCERLKWPLSCTRDGFEMDQYDGKNAMYIVAEDDNGRHAGSMRLMPLQAPTMLREYFSQTVEAVQLDPNNTWECTRFCLAKGQNHKTSLALLAAGARLMMVGDSLLRRLVAVFDEKMIRVYRRSNVEPEVLGRHTYDFGSIAAGRWSFDLATYRQLIAKSGLDHLELELALVNADLSQIYAGQFHNVVRFSSVVPPA